jgi:hypothetical protein
LEGNGRRCRYAAFLRFGNARLGMMRKGDKLNDACGSTTQNSRLVYCYVEPKHTHFLYMFLFCRMKSFPSLTFANFSSPLSHPLHTFLPLSLLLSFPASVPRFHRISPSCPLLTLNIGPILSLPLILSCYRLPHHHSQD